MSGAISAAVITSAVIGAGASLYSANEQSKAQKEAQKKRDIMKMQEQERMKKIQADARPEEESATVEFGGGDTGDAGGSYDDFLISATSTSKLGSSGGSGLGSSNPLSSLGMGA